MPMYIKGLIQKLKILFSFNLLHMTDNLQWGLFSPFFIKRLVPKKKKKKIQVCWSINDHNITDPGPKSNKKSYRRTKEL